MLVRLHLDVVLGDTGHQRRDILVCLPKLLLILRILVLEVIQLSRTLNLESFVLLCQVLHTVNKVDSFAFDRGRFILVVSLNLRDFFIGHLNGLLGLFPCSLGIILAQQAILELAVGLSQLVLGHLCFLAERLNVVFILGLGHFVIGNEPLVLLVLCLEQVDFMLEREDFGLRVLPLLIQLLVKLTDLFLKLVRLLLCTRSFFSKLEVFFTFIFHLAFLDGINLDFF